MATEVQDLSMFEIIANSFKKTFSNWKEFLKFLLLPYLGIVFGFLISILPAILVGASFKGDAHSSLAALITIILGIIIGMAIFIYSFWIYMVRSAACFNIAKKMIDEGVEKIEEDFKEAEKNITQRSGSYVKFLLWSTLFGTAITIIVVSLIVLLFGKGIFFPAKEATIAMQAMYQLKQVVMQILGLIIGMPLILSLASFVFNPDLKPLNAIIKGVKLVFNNFLPTLGFSMLIGIIVYTMSFILNIALFIVIFAASLPLIFATTLTAGTVAIILFGIFFVLVVIAATIATVMFTLLIGMPLYSFLLTHWYLRLEAKGNTKQLQQEGVEL